MIVVLSRSSVCIEGIIDASRLDAFIRVVIYGCVIVCNWILGVETHESHLREYSCTMLYCIERS